MMANTFENLEPSIRNAVRALIVRDDCLLLLRKDGDGQGERFALPGGAQDPGETLTDALQRECLEEIGTHVDIGELLIIADYFKPRKSQPPSTRHLLEFLFSCKVPRDYTPRNGHHPDKSQVEVVWKRFAELDRITLLPGSLADDLRDIIRGSKRGYVGTID